ncbi:hypothetical protein AX16_005250 [Volvariella volvacea WC 439]|nr:hypothetical protein AX16_005250 [Volvariella volvacea WC 439]
MQKPLGPRTQGNSGFRTVSPAPPTLLPEPRPLNIRKPPHQLSPPAHTKPVLSLSISAPRSVTPTSKPSIRLAIPIAKSHPNGSSQDTESRPFPTYYGGPDPSEIETVPLDHDATIQPLTVRPANHQRPDSVNEIGEALTRIELRSSPPLPNPHPPSTEDDAVRIMDPSGRQWSDDDLEELGRLGEGAGGAVHKVKDKRSGHIMARKTITTGEAPVKQVVRELSIISTTKHINIIQFYGAYMSQSKELKIIMEYCEGGSLEAIGKRIKERGRIVAEKIAGRLAEGVLQGLAYLHTRRTIHRDIKPSNILVSRDGVVKLCDFGVSGELVDSMAGTFTGTSFYMAPERICGHEYTIRSDVWSTGISLLELVQNKFPFPNDLPPIELMMYITTGDVSWSSLTGRGPC